MNLDRFYNKIEITNSCWLWKAGIDKDGYGKFYMNGKHISAHRASYKLFIGEIPEGLQIDHLCRVRNCVNPEHLEAVTCKVNIQRGETGLYQTLRTHCPQGHRYTDENTFLDDGSRKCRECRKVYHKKRRQDIKELLLD